MVHKLFKILLVALLVVPLQVSASKKKKITLLGVKTLLVCGNETVNGNLTVGGTLTVNGVDFNSLAGIAGAIGAVGPQGIQGIAGVLGAIGAAGPAGAQGIAGVIGAIGAAGAAGAPGTPGLPGIPGVGGILGWAQYVQLGSQPATVAAGQPFTYTTAVVTTPDIIQQPAGIYGSFTASGTVFQLASAGVYEVNYQTNFPTPSGVVIYTSPSLNGTYSPLPYTMIGKDTTDTGGQVGGSVIVVTTTANTFISVNAAAGNSSAIGVPPNSSTTNQSATTVSFKRLS